MDTINLTTQNWYTCLKDPKIDRILFLTELYEHGLTQQDIFNVLDEQGDKGIQKAIKQLEENKLIKQNYGIHPKITISYTTEKRKIKEITHIGIGNEGVRKAWKPTQNPITFFFEKLISNSQPTEEGLKIIQELNEYISNAWEINIKQYDFNSELINFRNQPPTEDLNAIEERLRQKLSLIQPPKEKELVEQELNDLLALKKEVAQTTNMLITYEKKNKEITQKFMLEILNGMKNIKDNKGKLYETHIDYIILILERLIQEEFITHYTKLYEYVNAETIPTINIKRLELINKLAYILKTGDTETPNNFIQNGIAGELVDRLRNFHNLIELLISQKFSSS